MAVVHRLRFMHHFYQSLYLFDYAMTNSVGEGNINGIYKHLNASLELIPQIKKTMEKGTQPIPASNRVS
ncbi:N-alpha-acetyltransferase 35, NatC auxiliary subunit homolog [Glossina fuscipes]|uniref:N-alpha-acetyltransferase 35, NatC auxiliary subunit homolog n=1 Tax=Glossina fuscipes TaxID=7396 RepID=A0A9C6DYD0_9MUSC|nr:N-alpha-acetyltransferase 35, NatC auxiliary subunit homolog [Glossina fuscipes]